MSVTSMTDRAEAIVAELNDAGVRCTLATPTATPPCAVMRMPAMLPVGNPIGACTSRAVVWEIYLVAKGASDWVAWKRLEQMVSICFELWGPAVRSCTPDLYPLDSETDAPAYRLTFEELL